MTDVIRTKRLEIKPFLDEDETAMTGLLTNEIIKESYMIPDFQTEKEAADMFKKLQAASYSEEHYERGIYADKQLIGFVNDVEMKDGAVELGYVIHPAYQNQGYATEMLEAVIGDLFRKGFRQVGAGAFESNTASMKVMQKCGMTKVEKEEDISYHGIRHHCLYFAVDGREKA